MTDDLSRAEIEAMAKAMLERHGFGFYLDPMEGGQDAYDLSLEAIEAATAAHAAVSRVREERGYVVVPSNEPCPYCSDGKQTGLPSNACENCMNTGLKYPAAHLAAASQQRTAGD